jgi:XTP/dITP diphosphohydrolase
MTTLVLASGNAGKLAEFRQLLAPLGATLIAQRELGIEDPPETGPSFVENALIKARNAAARSGKPALADDSGLIVDALGGEPGLYSADWCGRHGDAAGNIAKLLAALAGVPPERRQARFVSVIVALRHAHDPLPLIAQGVWEGTILTAPRGSGGFGYDPVFYDPGLSAGAAELDPAAKNRVSHRARALAALAATLPGWLSADWPAPAGAATVDAPST